ncbi:MAG: alternative ribosome rescue aminoacyl-tRNA hydrolase ArfB [Pseudomonadota bacterium]
MPLHITDTIQIEDWELTETFARASGPGGQNVNKVETAVVLRFEAQRSPNLPPDVKVRLKRLAGRRWTTDGAVIIQADQYRSQNRNREDAQTRLADLIRKATERPKKRIPTRPSLGAKRRRLDAKTRRSAIKTARARPAVDD